ncbi:MAG: hypothetical protein QOI66_5000 [Myxococcales bacterium]|jgi:hypothetical protein|nr:hypothetical protein [Myxococcales bacterium]
MKHPACNPIVRLSFGVLFAVAACGKSSSSPGAVTGTGGQAGGGGGGGGGGITGTATGCPNSQVTIVFSPMYSAFDGVHHFQIPAVVSGIDPDTVKWSASDPSMVDIAADDTTGGAMITVQKAGEVSIIATAGTLCGASKLTITAATTDDWEAGSARYNDGVVITRPPRGDGGVNPDAAADAASPREAACTNCHGDNATLLQYKTVQHTPEQAGGFSDAELKNIFMNGMVPMGGYFDTMIVSYATWQTFHKWQMTDDEAKGIIVYLRSLTPSKQTGSGNFGGRFDGGFPEGGGRRDGGGREGGGREGGGRPETGNDVAADVASD